MPPGPLAAGRGWPLAVTHLLVAKASASVTARRARAARAEHPAPDAHGPRPGPQTRACDATALQLEWVNLKALRTL
jgi:hypothetical protein